MLSMYHSLDCISIPATVLSGLFSPCDLVGPVRVGWYTVAILALWLSLRTPASRPKALPQGTATPRVG